MTVMTIYIQLSAYKPITATTVMKKHLFTSFFKINFKQRCYINTLHYYLLLLFTTSYKYIWQKQI